MTIIKHKTIKSSDYNAAVEYLEYEHNRSEETIKDEYGILQLRDNFINEGINYEPLSFNNECPRICNAYQLVNCTEYWAIEAGVLIDSPLGLEYN